MSETHSLDQSIVLTGKDVNIFDVVAQIAENAKAQNDPYIALNAAAQLRKWGQVTGLALAKLLYILKTSWDSFGTDDVFEDAAAAEIGISIQTVTKYTRIWEEVILRCPPELQQTFLGFPVESLWLVAPASKHEQLDEQSWEELALAPDKKTVRGIIRKIRGKATSSESALVIVLERDGTVTARKGDMQPEPWAFVNLEKRNDPVVSEAIDRFLSIGVVVR